MRAGAYTIHQSLTAEAAAVLKLALGLARRRGHAQVTPLHVAFALLNGPSAALGGAFPSSSSTSSSSYGLLKRACLRSHPPASSSAAAHPLQCRALELCFNVALSRLPTTSAHSPPPLGASCTFASSLIQPSPTLSNALVAALKRAQANQRRGCVELHQQPAPAAAQQQQQPLLAIKVELDQLAISILDDPSVSRVMREAGFSSAAVKSSLEEDSALMPPLPNSSSSASASPPPPPPHAASPHFFLDHPSIPATGGGGNAGMWTAQFPPAPGPGMMADDDVRAVLAVMVRGQGRRSNPVVVGDSVWMAEAVAGELLRRLERGGDDVPADLAGAHLLRLHLSYVHVRLMSRADVDARAAELRHAAGLLQRGAGGAGLVVYVGDLRWAIDEQQEQGHRPDDDDAPAPYSPVEHMVAELGRLLDDLRAARGRAWLVATASYQTYMRWQQRRRRQAPEVEAAWAMQAVLVPTGGGTGLALNSLHPSSTASAATGVQVQPAMATPRQPEQRLPPFAMAPPACAFAERDGQQQDELVLCTECSRNYEREASLARAEADTGGPRAAGVPAWLVPDRLPLPSADQAQSNKDKYLIELKRKWSRLCRKLHLCVVDPPCSAAPCPWWSGPCFPPSSRPSIAGLMGLEELMMPHNGRTTEGSPSPAAARPGIQDVGTALALGALPPLSDTATSDGRALGNHGDSGGSARDELERRLRRNIPWQPSAVAAEIAQAVAGQRTSGGDGGEGAVWLYVKGSDRAAVQRAAAVIADTRSAILVCADPTKFRCAEEFCSDVASRADSAVGGRGRRPVVLVVGDVERAPGDVVRCLVAASQSGALGDRLDLSGSVVILAPAKLPDDDGNGNVISLRLRSEGEEAVACGNLKRKPDTPSPTGRKRPRKNDTDGLVGGLDLNIGLCAAADDNDEACSTDDEEEAVPSDITHEGSSVVDDDTERDRPRSVLESVACRVVVTLDDDTDIRCHIRARLARALGVAQAGTVARMDEEAVEALAAASGHFLDETLDRWAAEVLEPAVAATTVRKQNGGNERKVVLGLGGARQPTATTGFMGSALPSRVHVD